MNNKQTFFPGNQQSQTLQNKAGMHWYYNSAWYREANILFCFNKYYNQSFVNDSQF